MRTFEVIVRVVVEGDNNMDVGRVSDDAKQWLSQHIWWATGYNSRPEIASIRILSEDDS